jgi:hypothetical protein
MAVNPYEAAKNLGLGKGYSVGIMAKRPTMPRGPSGPALRMPSFKLPDLSVNLPSVNLKSPTFTQNFDPKVRTMYADDYDAFMANKASEAAKATNATTPGTPAVMGSPDATAPKPIPTVGEGRARMDLDQFDATSPDLMSSSRRPGKPGSMDMVEESRRRIQEIVDLPDDQYAKWLEENRSNRPGGMDQVVGQMRARKKAGIPPGAVQIPHSHQGQSGWDPNGGAWKMPNGSIWETDGKGGWREKGFLSKYKEFGPPPSGSQVEPRKFSWREGEKAPERDWEAILDFQKFVGSEPGPYIEGKGRTINLDVDKALKNPGMVNESFAKNLTVTNLTPELRSSLEAKGFKFKTWDEKLFPGMNKLGDGKLGIVEFGSAVDAMKSLAALKAAGADTNMEGLKQGPARGFYG